MHNITVQPSSFVILLVGRRLQLNDVACKKCSSCTMGDKERDQLDLMEAREPSGKETVNDRLMSCILHRPLSSNKKW